MGQPRDHGQGHVAKGFQHTLSGGAARAAIRLPRVEPLQRLVWHLSQVLAYPVVLQWTQQGRHLVGGKLDAAQRTPLVVAVVVDVGAGAQRT